MRRESNRQRVIKWGVVAVCAMVVAVCAVTSQSMALTKRGVVIGVGIERTDAGYVVYSQFVVAGASGKPESGSSYEVVQGEGGTVMEAFEAIAKKSSLHPSYAHCKVLFVGKSLHCEKLDGVMRGLMRSNYLGNVQVVAVDDAYTTITDKVPIFPTTAAYIERDNMLVSKSGGRRLVSVKDYCQRIGGKSGNQFLPYAVREKAQKPTGEMQNTDDNEEVYLYDLFHTMAFDEQHHPHYYGNEVTQSVGLVEAKSGQFTAYTEDGHYVCVRIKNVWRTRGYRDDTVMGHYRYTVELVEQTLGEEEPPSGKIEHMVAAQIDEAMRRTFEQCKRDGVDIFSVTGHLYKRYGRTVPLDKAHWEREVVVRCK